MRIWVDADACPKAIKDILFRAAERVRVPLVLVANKPLRIPRSRTIKAVQVPAGFDAADVQIVGQVLQGEGRFTTAEPHVVVYEGQATHDSVSLRTRTTTEYDGCMKIEMEMLPGAAKEELEALWQAFESQHR